MTNIRNDPHPSLRDTFSQREKEIFDTNYFTKENLLQQLHNTNGNLVGGIAGVA